LVVAGDSPKTLAGTSRFCPESLVYPSPSRKHEEFVETLKREGRARGITILFPMTDVTTRCVLQHRDELSGVRIPIAPLEAFEALSDKWRLSTLAGDLNVPVPRTRVIVSPADLRGAVDAVGFPLVIKPCRSHCGSESAAGSPSVRYAWSMADLTDLTDGKKDPCQWPLLVQEYIAGHGRGVFALYDRGKPITFFAHRRLRERPPSGGVSVLSESVRPDPYLVDLTQRILDHVRWHGVAMAEFRIGPDGAPYLLEVNARFWGSLQLAIDAGVDFPWLLYQLAAGIPPDPVKGYAIGVKSRWLLGDLDHLYLQLKHQPAFFERWRAVLQFIHPCGPHTRHEVNRWEDPLPMLFELKHYILG
jgi:predicted ATP-grasp superfamily ATP-dependent carboligase